MFQLFTRKTGILVISFLLNISSTAQNPYQAWEHPVLRALDVQDSSYAGFGTYEQHYVNVMALHKASGWLYYFTRYGFAYDSLRVDDATAALLLQKKIKPLTIYKEKLRDVIAVLQARRHALRQKPPGKIFQLDKLLPIEAELSDWQCRLFSIVRPVDISYFDNCRDAGIETPHGTIKSNIDSVVWYNANRVVQVYKAVLHKKQKKLCWFTRSGRVLDSMRLDAQQQKDLLQHKIEPFVLLRLRLEQERYRLAQQLKGGKQNAKQVAAKRVMADEQLFERLTRLANYLWSLTVPDSVVMAWHFHKQTNAWDDRYEIRGIINGGYWRQLRGYRGMRRYELTNHLGNVLVVMSDKRYGRAVQQGDSIADHFVADVVRVEDYYPFGMAMPGRSTNADSAGYRYGFNGKEGDGETGWQDYGMRIYQPGLGRFLSVDPLMKEYPWNSTYAYAENDPVNFIDIDGEEKGKKLDYVDKSRLLRVGMLNTAKKIFEYKGLLAVTHSQTIKDLISNKIKKLQGNYTNGLVWLYKNKTNIEIDKLQRVKQDLIFVAEVTLAVSTTALMVYGGAASVSGVVDAFEAGGLARGLSALATEAVEFCIADQTGLPIKLNINLTKTFGAYENDAIGFIKGHFITFHQQGYKNIGSIIRKFERSVKTLNKTIDEHIDKIQNPQKYVKNWSEKSAKEKEIILSKWNNDIKKNEARRNTVQQVIDLLSNLKTQ